jgi:hypothetical protein
MVLQIELPEDISRALSERWSDMPRHVLETLAIQGYRAGVLSEHQVGRMLGFETRGETNEFLLRAGQFYDYDEQELEQQVEVGRQAADEYHRSSE